MILIDKQKEGSRFGNRASLSNGTLFSPKLGDREAQEIRPRVSAFKSQCSSFVFVEFASGGLVWFTVCRGARWRSDFLPPCSQQSPVSWVVDLWTFSWFVFFFTVASFCPCVVLTLIFHHKPGVSHRCSSTVPSSSEHTPSFSASICMDTHAESIGNKDRQNSQSLPPKSMDFSLL